MGKHATFPWRRRRLSEDTLYLEAAHTVVGGNGRQIQTTNKRLWWPGDRLVWLIKACLLVCSQQTQQVRVTDPHGLLWLDCCSLWHRQMMDLLILHSHYTAFRADMNASVIWTSPPGANPKPKQHREKAWTRETQEVTRSTRTWNHFSMTKISCCCFVAAHSAQFIVSCR